VSTVTPLTTAEVDRRIEEFRNVLDRTTGRLVELDADVTRRLLETSHELRGATAAAWADASSRHAALWQSQLALETLLMQIMDERGEKRSASLAALVRLDGLLEGASVELPRSPESGPPRLTDEATPTVACSVAQVFEQMSTDFAVVTEFVGTVARTWGELTNRLDELAAFVLELEKEIQTSGMRRPNDLGVLARTLAEAKTTAQVDPISLESEEVTLLESRAQRLGEMVHGATRVQQAELEELVAADRSIGAGLEALATCRTQLDRWSEKIVVPDATLAELDRLSRELDLLRLECERAPSPGIGIPVAELRRRADALLAEVTQMTKIEGVRMERRDELRGLLGAYQAKASAVGLAESLEIDGLYAAARDALYRAPCNLEEGERCVTAFQRAIRRLQEGSNDGRV
jgi:hypothetical protein